MHLNFDFTFKPFVMCFCFCEPIKNFHFFNACQMTVLSLVLHIFAVPQRGRHKIVNKILAAFFSVLLLWILIFPPLIYGPHTLHLGHKLIYSMDLKIV